MGQNDSTKITSNTNWTSDFTTAQTKPIETQYESQENLVMGIVAGIVAALIGAGIWAGITVTIHYQIGWMAVGLGFLVGFAIRYFGKGTSEKFGLLGAGLALFGCLLGNVLSGCGAYALDESIPFINVAFVVLTHPSLAWVYLKETFSFIDVIFYGLAIYEGYRFSFNKIRAD